jgi:hypothetical protein
MQYIVCYDEVFGYWDRMSMDFQNNTDFVDELRRLPHQKNWYKHANASWNDDPNPKLASTLTRFGVGNSFNLAEDSSLLNLNPTSTDFRYSYGDDTTKPTRPWSTGAQTGNKFKMKALEETSREWIFSMCRPPSFIVHSPFELPIGKKLTQFSYNQLINVWITPEIIEAEDDLRSFDLEERKCYFEDERSLKYFKVYTQKNCEMECLSFIGE